jgi:N-acetylglutamate synthase
LRLKPTDIGRRVVVRTTVGDEIGPSGGPALTDTLGQLESWSDTTIGVRKDDGTLVTIARAEVMAAKTVPPRPSRRIRVSDDTLERIAAAGWLPRVTRPLGDWLMRAAGGFTGRANSVLVIGDPGVPLDDALDEVRAFYAEQRLPVRAQVVVDSAWDRTLIEQGWVDDRPQEGGVLVQVASVPAAVKKGQDKGRGTGHWKLTIKSAPSPQWLAKYGRGDEVAEPTLRTLLTSGDDLAFVQLGEPITAIGRASITGDWVGLYAVTVDRENRRRGQGSDSVGALLDWAAERGAVSAYLQVPSSNRPARSLYESFGFVTHHRYHYLRGR